MFGLNIKGAETKQSLRRKINNLGAEILRNPSSEKRKELERLRQRYNNWNKKK